MGISFTLNPNKSNPADKQNFADRVARYKNSSALSDKNIFYQKNNIEAGENLRLGILYAHSRVHDGQNFEDLRDKYSKQIDRQTQNFRQLLDKGIDPTRIKNECIQIGQNYFINKYPGHVPSGTSAEKYIKDRYQDKYSASSPHEIEEHSDRFFTALYLQKALEDAHEYRADLIERYNDLVKTSENISGKIVSKNEKYLEELRKITREVQANIKTFQMLEAVVKEVPDTPHHKSDVEHGDSSGKTKESINQLYKLNNFFVSDLKNLSEKQLNEEIYKGSRRTFGELKQESLKFKNIITKLSHVSEKYEQNFKNDSINNLIPFTKRNSVKELSQILKTEDFVHKNEGANDISNIPTKSQIKKELDKEHEEIKNELELLEQERKQKRNKSSLLTGLLFLAVVTAAMILGFYFVEEIEFFGEATEDVQNNDVNESVTTQEPDTADNQLADGNERNDDTYIDPEEYGEARELNNEIECSTANPCDDVTVTKGEETTQTRTNEPARAAVVTTMSVAAGLVAVGLKSIKDLSSQGVRSRDKEQSLARDKESVKSNSFVDMVKSESSKPAGPARTEIS